jgi:hypothetical protein
MIYLTQTNHTSNTPLARATERWKKLWQGKSTSDADSPSDLVRAIIGSEYGWLAQVLLQEKPYHEILASNSDPLENLSDLLNRVCSRFA